MSIPVKMEPEKVRIIYMGTPGFAIGPLEGLIRSGCQVAAVVTAPDKPSGRGKKISFSPVKQYLREQHPHLPLLQPANLKDTGFIGELESLQPDLQVIVAFRMLPEAVWRIPPLGTFNLHASLLPQYRGAAPINHVIINGEQETGVTTFLIDQQIDTGNILLRERIPIGEKETAGELHDHLMELGSDLVLRTVRGLAAGTLPVRRPNG
jgi:methionyl-tRNA formyltransferase